MSEQKSSPQPEQPSDARQPLTPEQRKELLKRAQAKLKNPEPVPEDEQGGMLINYR
jgi:hypothetical protein